MRSIALIDQTTTHRPPAGVLEAIADALTVQINRDFAPVWDVEPARVTVGGRGQKIHFFDGPAEAEEFGFHVVDPEGEPYAHVYAGQSITRGSDWLSGEEPVAVTASHEALEMLGDPAANSFAFDGDQQLWAREVCDPVQADTYRIVAGGKRVPVSDFVLPDFFNPWADGHFDHLRVLDAPFTLAPGGYAIYQHAGDERETSARRFTVDFDVTMPRWQRERKLNTFGRTYWRLLLAN